MTFILSLKNVLAWTNTNEEYDDDMMEARGVCIRVHFVCDEQLGCLSKTKPQIASLDELKISFCKVDEEE